MNRQIFSFGSMTLLVGGAALALLLVFGWTGGQELPLWPAVLVALVNLVAAGKLFLEVRARKANQAASPAPAQKRKK